MLYNIVFLGAAVQFLGGSAYVWYTLKGKTQPNRVTWFLWMIAPFIGVAAAFADGVTWAILPVFMAGFVPLCVLIASFINPNAYWKIGKFDYYCGAIALLALVLWFLTNEPVVAVLFAGLADGVAALPTLVKAWRFPETETGIAYATAIFGVSTSFFAVQMWSVSEVAFQIYLILINCALIFAIYRKRIFAPTQSV